jgi:DNA-binding protein H-NS
MDERKRDSMVAYLRRRMTEFGIEPDDLADAIAQDQSQQRAARYRSATGDTWSGVGEMPQWLAQAVSAGQSVEHFAVERNAHPVTSARSRIDWREDPFAGGRLATIQASESNAR